MKRWCRCMSFYILMNHSRPYSPTNTCATRPWLTCMESTKKVWLMEVNTYRSGTYCDLARHQFTKTTSLIARCFHLEAAMSSIDPTAHKYEKRIGILPPARLPCFKGRILEQWESHSSQERDFTRAGDEASYFSSCPSTVDIVIVRNFDILLQKDIGLVSVFMLLKLSSANVGIDVQETMC